MHNMGRGVRHLLCIIHPDIRVGVPSAIPQGHVPKGRREHANCFSNTPTAISRGGFLIQRGKYEKQNDIYGDLFGNVYWPRIGCGQY